MEKTVKKQYILENLGCPNCAAKMEDKIKKLENIENAYVNFVNKKLELEMNGSSTEDTLRKISNIIFEIEPDVKMVDLENVDEEQTQDGSISILEILQIAIAFCFFILALILEISITIKLLMYTISYVIVGGEVLLRAAKNIIKGQYFDENFLMSIATIGAFGIGEYPEGVAVMLFYKIGELFQDYAVDHSRKSIRSLMNIRPDYANLLINNEIKIVSPNDINIGDIIVIKPGERVPLDGKVIEGNSTLDTSALTGESVPIEVEKGNDILSGSININGVLTVEVMKKFGESTVTKIIDLVQNASGNKAKTENFITKFSKVYTPIVVFAALALALIPPMIIPYSNYFEWINRALVFLVISCPCALVISIPLGFFGGIGGASKNGILIKGSNYLEALNNIDTIIFDKTGTLTKGVFKVTKINSVTEEAEESILEYAAFAECYSNHPIALSILKAYGKEIDKNSIESYDEFAGLGIKVIIEGKEIIAGNPRLMKKEDIVFDEIEEAGSVIYVTVNKKYMGYIVISDEVKEDSQIAIKKLKNMGVKKIVMLTGDCKQAALKIGKELELDEVHSGLLPNQKVEILEELKKQKSNKGSILFVGDGINDAPVLAQADVGIAMGGLGSDAAIEAADIVLMTDEPTKIVNAIKIAKRTRKIVWENIIFALGVKIVVLILGAGGIATMWEAVFADVGVSLIAVINAMRALKTKK